MDTDIKDTNTQKKTILIVEDERPLLEVVQLKLEGEGFDVITARSVAQALDFLEEVGTIHAVWLDHYLLGVQDGIQFVQQLKAIPQWTRVPVFVISNSASEDTRRAYTNLGVSRYYVKSDYRMDEIVDDMKEVLAEG